MITQHPAIPKPPSRTVAATFGLLAAIAIATPGLTAQRRGSAPRSDAPVALTLVERALRLGDRLELTSEQRGRLEAIRTGLVEQRAARSTRMMKLASEVRSGISEAGAVREALAAMREKAGANRRELRGKYDDIFTDEQQQQLRRLTRLGAWRQRGVQGRGPAWDRDRGRRGPGEMDRGRGGGRFRGWWPPGERRR